METKTTPVHPLLEGTSPGPYTKGMAVASVGGSLYPIDGPARIDGLYNKTRAKKLIHQLNAAHNAACPSLAAENALLAEQVKAATLLLATAKTWLLSHQDRPERALDSIEDFLTSLTPASKP